MKKVKYNGHVEPVILYSYGKIVNKDDVVDVEDDFVNAQFSDVVEEKPQKDGGSK